jgi:uncharacterized membrane protein
VNKDKLQHHTIVGSSVLLMVFVGLALFVVSMWKQSPVQTVRPVARRFVRNVRYAMVHMEAALRLERA